MVGKQWYFQVGNVSNPPPRDLAQWLRTTGVLFDSAWGNQGGNMESEVQCLNCWWEGYKAELAIKKQIVIKNDIRPRCPECNSIRLKYSKK